MQKLREDSRHIFAAGVAAVDPIAAVQRAVVRQGDTLHVHAVPVDLRRYAHVYVVGAGKAGATMARGLEEVLGERLTAGIVTVKYGHRAPVSRVTIYEAAHPIPDAAGVRSAEGLIRLAQQASADDLAFCLLSGGGSALLPTPSPGITLEEKQQVTSLLLECGASIDEINVIRKHISRLKGGQLARLVAPAMLITLVLSDVVGDRLDVIASGPTVPDPTTYQNCLEIIRRYNLLARLPASVRSHLQRGQAGEYPGNAESHRSSLRELPDRDYWQQSSRLTSSTRGGSNTYSSQAKKKKIKKNKNPPPPPSPKSCPLGVLTNCNALPSEPHRCFHC